MLRKNWCEISIRGLFMRNTRSVARAPGGCSSAIAHLELVKVPSRALSDDFGVE